jgi:hypothetical protein
MNKQTMAIIGVIVVLVAGFFIWRNQGSDSNQVSGDRITGSNSLSSLLGMGKNLVCTFDYADESGEQKGTVYIAGEKMSGEFTITDSEGSVQTSIIRDDEYQYLWGDGMEQGVKFKLSAMSELEGEATTPTETEESVDLDQQYNVDCDNWRVDDSKFVPPSNVEFMDYSAQAEATASMMQSLPEAGAPQMDASICDQVPAGPARDQCIASLQR